MRPIDADKLIENGFKNPISYNAFVNLVKRQPTIKPKPEWHPIMDGDGEIPPVDEEGYSDWILISFSNMDQLVIGQYREDEDGGAFYDGDDAEPLSRFGLLVNACAGAV